MTKRRTLEVRVEHFPYAQPFRITGHVFTETAVVVAEISQGADRGRGEAAGAYYLKDDVAAMTGAIERAREAIEAGADRSALQKLLPPCGGRNALDCALWDLEAQQSGRPVWQLAGLPEPKPLRTTLTIGADEPGRMADAAAALADATTLKLKLTGEAALDAARVEAVRAARPDCWIGVDANQGYSAGALPALFATLERHGVALLEQPLARGAEAGLDGIERAIPVAADESALSLAETDALVGRFDMVNIKLDKCGGLTEGIAIARRARELGLDVMVGNMMGSSLAMAPSYLLGQLCKVVDLDGPTFLARDRDPGVRYQAGNIHCPSQIWGFPR
ncbi:dipeptide epimerase [Novosphingobium sp. PC22D]|uniref:dipeptide epimerase n=1 Tax=Novosphingobium sp. PC22D TaxID=1962403 RepID=UPI000BF18BD4|nr:dipeptide epimerase [Novosphingobium sp. PC22D]PEQ14066.1 dipeptide epimerase [Novosphingobium sp. PC22D]